IALMDIDAENLSLAKQVVDRIVATGDYPAKVTATLDRAEALDGADGVLSTILTGDDGDITTDIAIPKEYGISINVGDTRGPSAIFRFLRTWPFMLEIVRDIETYAPDAIFLNYTNPMAMLCRAIQGVSDVRASGLCHSVQGTAEMLAGWIGAPMDEVTYVCAGINHQAHYLDYRWNGKDAYPLIREAVARRPEIYNEEQVRNEMFLHLGYYVTESSGHNSEYNAWFRKRPDLIEKYCTHGTGWNPGLDWMERHSPGYGRKERRVAEFMRWMSESIDLARGHEYATYIFNAVFGDNEMFEFNGNVRNWGLIDNLPAGCCVEVPVLASKGGLKPMHVGPLPPQLAILNSINAQCEELAVEGALEGDREKIFHACLYDPLTSSLLSMAEIKEMVDKLFRAEEKWLTAFA
ncbi:MAG: alpha-glucosidase/alpha-galactosidase, partial [Anaerolineae bacterium]|nr:alpha-glucosidase/alpha-galactosidase [Anaerolineae bacterium]